ncbi:tetratricopeptide repeat protein [Endozoicomonas sp. 8E]|uniref:tetratricopeptide repeat protein n=1 Tax=Endozoicomonas sp. 8E TaxID=3035692 RepID=UPI002938D42F|nr:tetratricopeptide repeat protein [Endozoicomonas sp. 8E]WOG26093.1 tetratricopeptide repeat protein [Endozoicomonas sp. 8E]
MNELPNIVDLTEENVREVLVEQSAQRPVLLDIWAEWCEPCKSQLPILANLVENYQGKFLLAKLDADQPLGQQLMAQLGVRSVPTLVFFHQGQPVQVLSGLQTEVALREVLDPLTISPVERIRLQVDQLIDEGQHEQALLLLQQILQEEPKNHALQVLQVNLLLEVGRLDDAKALMAVLPDDAAGIAQPRAKLAFYEMVVHAPQMAELEARLHDDEKDHEARYQLAIRQVIADENEQALENLLLIVRTDRTFREDGARLLMLKVFDQLGAGDPMAKRYRGKLFGLMH